MGARMLEQRRDDVDADHVAHERRDRECQRARAGADVEHPFVAERRHERPELLTHELDLLLGMLRDPFGRRTEASADLVGIRPLSHRRRCAARAAAC